MDDLYNNLENYHDDNIIDELKNENKELKFKLEEYSNALARLQNEFDNLTSEHKKLEMNYSSLLKTARAEVDRKSDLIKLLNVEKDQLVIKALQSTGTNILRNKRHQFNDTQQSSKKNGIDSECADNPQQKKDQLLDSNNMEKSLRNHRNNSTHPQSEGTLSSMENHSIFSDDSRKTNNYHRNKLHKNKVNDTKDIYSEEVKCSNYREYTNSNSQKFMRLSRVEPIYSSDDDLEEFNLKNIRKSSKEDTDYKSNYNRGRYFSPSRELYKNSSHQSMDHDKYRHTRYETGRNYRRHSPQNYKKDYGKEKKLRNQSPDKYSSKCRDRRFISEREKYFDNDRHLSHHGNSVVKHKIRNDHEESSSKRQRLEENTPTSNKSMYSKDQENVNLNKHNPTELSCQSPDYDIVDSTLPLQVIKEIKDTATTLLEDPRVSSQKYAIKKDKEKKMLSTIDSKNIDIKPINVSTWVLPNSKKFTLPETINHTELCSVTNKDLVSEISINIDKTSLNSQLDSEKIQRDIDNYCNLQADTKVCGEINNQNTDGNDTVHKFKETDSKKFQKQVTETNNFKIPKHDQKSDTVCTNSMTYDGEKSSEKYVCNIDKKGKCSKLTTTAQSESSNIKKVSDDNKQIEMIQKTCNKLIPEKTALSLSTLADDLELSDEANENKDSQKDTLVCNKKSKKILINDKACAVSVDLNEYQSDLPQVKDKHTEPKENNDLFNSKKETLKELQQENNKARKIKKKSAQKHVSTESNVQSKQTHTIVESKDKDHKHFVSIQTKNKFSDLFGDSSSLITPDDLGIPSPEILPLDDKYVSVFDNTQDAVDLNVEDLHKTQCDSTKVSAFPIILKDLSADKTVIEQTGNALNILTSEESAKNATENTSSANILFNKIEPERFHSSSEVVKTLIISSGVQPTAVQYVPENNKLQNSEINDTEFPNIIQEDKNKPKKCAMSDIKALATSTPHKFIHEKVSLQVSDLNGQHYSDKISEEINVSSNTSNSSKQVINEADIPDLRIIVKRRRKIIKKP